MTYKINYKISNKFNLMNKMIILCNNQIKKIDKYKNYKRLQINNNIIMKTMKKFTCQSHKIMMIHKKRQQKLKEKLIKSAIMII